METLKTFLGDLIFTSPLVGSWWMVLLSFVVSSLIIFNAWFRKYPIAWVEPKVMALELWEKTKKYFPNALWQQAIFVTVFFWSKEVWGWEIATVVSAIAFGLVGHMGVPLLMGWCAAMGCVYGIFYNHYPNIWILIVTHGYLATILFSFTPESLTQGGRVWRRE